MFEPSMNNAEAILILQSIRDELEDSKLHVISEPMRIGLRGRSFWQPYILEELQKEIDALNIAIESLR